jgi:lipopolysaccharide transport system ATP-binding protein
MSHVAIRVEDLSKAYQLGEFSTGTISKDIERWFYKLRGKEDPFLKIGETNDRSKKSTSNIVWSLQDINFEINLGDAVGIIGRNGAGKSTMLKIISRVTSPTKGNIKVKGRIASLLEVGTGFHPELTGRENIFLNGAILGMRKKEIERKFDEIVDFSGVERYIDTPVKRYSSGMYVRLAFAVAAHLDSEILVVDEVLAVGDAEFQKKCIWKMNDVSKSEGRTVLFVSHNMASIESLCKKGIYLRNGKLECVDNIQLVIKQYLDSKSNEHLIPLIERNDRTGIGNIKLTNVKIDAPEGVITGSKFKVTANYTFQDKNIIHSINEFGMSIWTDREVRLVSLSSTFKGDLDQEDIPGSGSVSCEIEDLPLIQGEYILNFFLASTFGIEDEINNCVKFQVEESDYYGRGKVIDPGYGAIAVKHKWMLNGK